MEEHLLSVQRMQDWIAQNPGREITLSELSRVSLFSPWYSHRLFREHLGLTPAEYVRKLRLSMAAVRLKEGKERILDIGFDLGFFQRRHLYPGLLPGIWAESQRLRQKSRAHPIIYPLRCKIPGIAKGDTGYE